MSFIIALLLSITPILAADDIAVITRCKTNLYPQNPKNSEIVTHEYFTRGGLTNMTRVTATTTNGIVKMTSHRFYHNGNLAATHWYFPKDSESSINCLNGYWVDSVSRSNVLIQVLIGKNGELLDEFEATNQLLRPMETSDLKKRKAELENEKDED